MAPTLWNLFPQLLVQKINALLDTAEPNPIKSYQLYKACERENLWNQSYEAFAAHLRDYFSQPLEGRAKSYFDCFLDRPMSRHIYDDFKLNFRTASVNASHLLDTVNWTHHQMREGCNTDCEVVSADVLMSTMQLLTNPPPYEKEQDIEFEDFCISWKQIVFNLFGKKYDPEMNHILKELRWLQAQLKKNQQSKFVPGIYLTQTEIDWTTEVQHCMQLDKALPEFPLSRGAQKPRLMELERAVKLYNIVQITKVPELLRHQENIKLTILDKCEWLLREKAS